jgi:hypothetical protein
MTINIKNHQPVTYAPGMDEKEKCFMYLVMSDICPAAYANTNSQKHINCRLVDQVPPTLDLTQVLCVLKHITLVTLLLLFCSSCLLLLFSPLLFLEGV